jgi:uncharacterized protein YhaN
VRIAQLNLRAYGHFTKRVLEFPGNPDFHIVYGPNEAGKTTMSRALRAALFGFPKATPDDYMHQYANLRVGVVLESSNGTLAAMRRKATKNSLIEYDPVTGEEIGHAIADDMLPRLMGGLSEGLYRSMFGLDHDELVVGGKALSEGRGEVGQSLFAAGAGLTAIKTLREELTKAADTLFRPRASTSAVFQTLRSYHAAKDAAKEAQTRPTTWEALRKAADDARSRYEKARDLQASLQQESRRLERLAAVLPDIATRSWVLEHLDAMGEVRRLDTDARENRIKAETLLRQAEDALAQAEAEVVGLQAELDAVPRSPSVLAEAAAIEAIYYSRTAYREARDGAVAANSRIQLASTQAAKLALAISDASHDSLRALIPTATERAKVQGLDSEGHRIKTELRQAVEAKKTTKGELEQLTDELDGLGAQVIPPSLQAAIRAFDADGNPETKAANLTRQAETQRSSLEQSAKALSGKELGVLVAMKIPLPTELQSFRDTRAEQESVRAILTSNIKKIEDDIGVVAGEIEGLMKRSEVPTAEHLAEQRQARDSMWLKIRRKAYPEGKPAEEPLPTPSEYEMAVQAADGTADSRFADAARVSQHADFVTRLAQMRNALALEQRRLAESEYKTKELDQQWQALLDKHSLPSMDIDGLTEWIAKHEGIVERNQSCVDSAAQASAAGSAAQIARINLSAALEEARLPPCGDAESLAQAIARTREHASQAGESAAKAKLLARQKIQAEARLAEAERKIAEGKSALGDWRTKWAHVMARIRLDGDALDTEATARLAQFEALEQALDTLDAARAELDTARTTETRVESEAKRLCLAIDYDPAQRPVDAVIESVYERLTEARKQEEKGRAIVGSIQLAEKASGQAKQSIGSANEALAALMTAAGCGSLQDLVEAEDRSTEYTRLESKRAEIEERLVKASGLSLQEILAQAAGQDIVQVTAALDRAADDLKAAVAQVEELHAKSIEAQGALDKIDDTAKASAAEQEAAGAAARMSGHLAEFAAVTVASAVLGDIIETYQQRHQGPLLSRASELFAAITGGQFAKVVTDFDEDRTVLLGVTHDGKRKGVGAMSSGRRDQLFLALRLAAIESHVASQRPVPVVVDDIVINFDDAAASATFKVLAELAAKTQVLFFTHHEHLLQRAEQALGAGKFRALAL